MREKRTEIDFSKHVLTVNKQEGLLVHTLAKPNTYVQSFVFINTNDIMAVTGDYGNWIFCREFHPSKDGYVSDTYWVEKLRIGSCQEPSNFDSQTAQEQVTELLNIPFDVLTPTEKTRLKELSICTKDALSKAIAAGVTENVTEEDIEMLKDILPDCDQYSEEEREWLQRLYEAADDGEYSYIAAAMDRPNSFPAECIPRGKIMNYHLKIIFDAFEEICARIAKEK